MNVKIPVSTHANIANITTSLGIVLGFVSLVCILNDSVRTGLTLYLITILADRIDGFLARKYNAESTFGKELDSLADALNFSFIPALIAYISGFNSWWMIVILVIYITAGIWRLAHFNMAGVEESEGSHYYFRSAHDVCRGMVSAGYGGLPGDGAGTVYRGNAVLFYPGCVPDGLFLPLQQKTVCLPKPLHC